MFNMSSEMSTQKHMESVIEGMRYTSKPFAAIDEATLKEWIKLVNKISSIICASYLVSFIDCGSKKHLRY